MSNWIFVLYSSEIAFNWEETEQDMAKSILKEPNKLQEKPEIKQWFDTCKDYIFSQNLTTNLIESKVNLLLISLDQLFSDELMAVLVPADRKVNRRHKLTAQLTAVYTAGW